MANRIAAVPLGSLVSTRRRQKTRNGLPEANCMLGFVPDAKPRREHKPMTGQESFANPPQTQLADDRQLEHRAGCALDFADGRR